MSCTDAFVRLQKASPLLARRLYQFNFCPADYVHPSRRSSFDGGKLNARVWATPRARAALSLHILRSLDLEDKPCFDTSCTEWPLLLLDAAQLDRLGRHLAAVIFNRSIRHSVRHDEVVMWRARLGIDGGEIDRALRTHRRERAAEVLDADPLQIALVILGRVMLRLDRDQAVILDKSAQVIARHISRGDLVDLDVHRSGALRDLYAA